MTDNDTGDDEEQINELIMLDVKKLLEDELPSGVIRIAEDSGTARRMALRPLKNRLDLSDEKAEMYLDRFLEERDTSPFINSSERQVSANITIETDDVENTPTFANNITSGEFTINRSDLTFSNE